ncbi:flagellar export chaperone FliS [bacterium]|nr:flagellar export chaperone FliS [bacterium]
MPKSPLMVAESPQPLRASAETVRAQRAYSECRVRGADPQQLLALLYDGLLQSVRAGQRALREKQWEEAQVALSKARRIVTYLSQSLRPEGGEITERLRPLYAYCFEGIGRASLEKRPELLDGVAKVVGELSGAWTALAQSPRQPALPPTEEV